MPHLLGRNGGVSSADVIAMDSVFQETPTEGEKMEYDQLMQWLDQADETLTIVDRPVHDLQQEYQVGGWFHPTLLLFTLASFHLPCIGIVDQKAGVKLLRLALSQAARLASIHIFLSHFAVVFFQFSKLSISTSFLPSCSSLALSPLFPSLHPSILSYFPPSQANLLISTPFSHPC